MGVVLKTHLMVLATLSALLLLGCYRYYDYEYLSLSRSMNVSQHGLPTLNGATSRSDMPISYVLERELYTLYASVDRQSIPPSVVFTVESKTHEDLALSSDSIRCFAEIRSIRPSEAERRNYPEAGLRFTWKPSFVGQCSDAGELSDDDRKLLLRISSNNSDFAAQEEVYFDIQTNGSYREWTGP